MSLHLTSEDLARVRLRHTLGPLAETFLALRALQSRPDSPLLGEWRRWVAGRLPAALSTVAAHLMPPAGLPVDLFALVGEAATLEQGLESLRGTPPRLVRTGLAAGPLIRRMLPTVLRGQPDVDHEALERVATLLAISHDTGIAPQWPGMLAHLDADRLARARTLADGGVERLLATLHPTMRWCPPVLEFAARNDDRSSVVHLHGRGLDLVPSIFCRRSPEVYLPADPAAPVLLIYRAVADLGAAGRLRLDGRPPLAGLAQLLGSTRAAVLAAAADGCTTGELARRLRISPAGASQHTTVLRRAGLVLSTRRGNTVMHTLTPLGSALLAGHAAPATPAG
jgi:DNA-binding transcriptional ArsR family regulator